MNNPPISRVYILVITNPKYYQNNTNPIRFELSDK
jgi:hypothetical protein